MEKTGKVIIVPCESYERETVYTAMKAGIRALGGIRALIGQEERILVKPNFLSSAIAEKAITTHPAVIEGMLRILHEEGYSDVSYGDSPGHGSSEAAANKLELPSCAARYGAKPANMDEEIYTPFPEGITAKGFYFAKGVTQADAIINLCKMKTHALERITGAVKNVYGFICGMRKAAGHVKYPNAVTFARMLADIHRCTDIRLHIMDGIVAMEGNGPASGDPIPMNVLLFSQDPVALDAVYCHMIYLDTELVPTCVQGELMGIGTRDLDRIELILASANPEESPVPISADELRQRFGNQKFKADRKPQQKTSFIGGYSKLMTHFAKRPVIKKELCVKCGICVNHCPVPEKAIRFRNGKSKPPVYDYSKCIRCYCCQEMCPQHAITVKGRG